MGKSKPASKVDPGTDRILASYFAANFEPAQVAGLFRQLRIEKASDADIAAVAKALSAGKPDKRLFVEGVASRKHFGPIANERPQYSDAYKLKLLNQQRERDGLPTLAALPDGDEEFAAGVEDEAATDEGDGDPSGIHGDDVFAPGLETANA